MQDTKTKIIVEMFILDILEKFDEEFPHLKCDQSIKRVEQADPEDGFVGFHLNLHFTNTSPESNYQDGYFFVSGLYDIPKDLLSAEFETYGEWSLKYYNHLNNGESEDYTKEGEEVPNRDRIVVLKASRGENNEIVFTKEV